MKFAKDNKMLSAVVVAGMLGLLAWLAFGFFGIQAAFIDNVVDEDGPIFDLAAPAAAVAAPTPVPTTAPVAEALDSSAPVEATLADESAGGNAAAPAAQAAPAEEPAPSAEAPATEAPAADVTVPDEPGPDEPAAESSDQAAAPAESAEPTAPAPTEDAQPAPPTPVPPTPVPATPVPATPVPTPVPVPEPTPVPQQQPGEIVTIASGQFRGLNNYSVSGNAQVLGNGTDQRFLRFENFAADNGPDLKVYLRAANGDFISLGDLSGNIGNQNYEIPAGVDLSIYNSVEIWCERFSSGFGTASLSAT